jgi:hypothetical protein
MRPFEASSSALQRELPSKWVERAHHHRHGARGALTWVALLAIKAPPHMVLGLMRKTEEYARVEDDELHERQRKHPGEARHHHKDRKPWDQTPIRT